MVLAGWMRGDWQVANPNSAIPAHQSGFSISRSPERLQQFRQPRIAGTADRQLRPVAKDGDAAVFRVQLDAGDALDVEEVRSVNPHEPRRIEESLGHPERLILEIGLAFRAKRYVVVLRFDVIDPVNRQHVDLR